MPVVDSPFIEVLPFLFWIIEVTLGPITVEVVNLALATVIEVNTALSKFKAVNLVLSQPSRLISL